MSERLDSLYPFKDSRGIGGCAREEGQVAVRAQVGVSALTSDCWLVLGIWSSAECDTVSIGLERTGADGLTR
jgi:hypothetical protein